MFMMKRSAVFILGSSSHSADYFSERLTLLNGEKDNDMEGQHQSLFELVSTNISAVLNDVINKLPCRGYSVKIDFERYKI